MAKEKTDNSISPIVLKMRRKIKVYTIIGFIFLVFQLMGYLGNLNKSPDDTSATNESFSYYIGFNFLLLTALVFFINAYRLKKNLIKWKQAQMIDLIGHTT